MSREHQAPNLILGPLLRYAGNSDATVWVETEAPHEVEIIVEGTDESGRPRHRSHTFSVEGHHYALVHVTGLEPGASYRYSVALDGEKVWPEEGSPFPPPEIRTLASDGEFNLVFGSCRVSAPHEPPYTDKRATIGGGFEWDALHALALRMLREPQESWPDALLLLGDQVYADEISTGTRDFVRSRRGSRLDPRDPPQDEVADFEEYTRLYRDSWSVPAIRWLLSTVPCAMIFDDHDVNDDWNTSEAWVKKMRAKPWWRERIIGAFMSYWIYQHLGNLPPEEIEKEGLLRRIKEAGDGSWILREFARRADREAHGSRWSFYRDFGRTRLLVVDSRAGRVLEEGHRSMLDDAEWTWLKERTNGDFDHLLVGTTLPFLLPPGLHHLEAWNEAIAAGAWGRPAAWLGEFIRQAVDLEHWPAFHDSFKDLARLLRSVAAGERASTRPPASVVVLSGDVHHGYLAKVDGFGDGSGTKSPVYQAVSSPMRNPLGLPERLIMQAGWSKVGERVGRTLARLAGVKETGVRWRMTHTEPWFDNQISTIILRGREASLKVEKTLPEDSHLYKIFEYRLA